jgi:hypothetical protein
MGRFRLYPGAACYNVGDAMETDEEHFADGVCVGRHFTSRVFLPGLRDEDS